MPLWLSNANFNLQREFVWHSLKDGNSPNLSLLPQKQNKTVHINAYFIPKLRVQVNFYFFVYVLSGWLRLADCHVSDSIAATDKIPGVDLNAAWDRCHVIHVRSRSIEPSHVTSVKSPVLFATWTYHINILKALKLAANFWLESIDTQKIVWDAGWEIIMIPAVHGTVTVWAQYFLMCALEHPWKGTRAWTRCQCDHSPSRWIQVQVLDGGPLNLYHQHGGFSHTRQGWAIHHHSWTPWPQWIKLDLFAVNSCNTYFMGRCKPYYTLRTWETHHDRRHHPVGLHPPYDLPS